MAAPPTIRHVVHEHSLVWFMEHLPHLLVPSVTYVGVTYDHLIPKLTLLAMCASGCDVYFTNPTKL